MKYSGQIILLLCGFRYIFLVHPIGTFRRYRNCRVENVRYRAKGKAPMPLVNHAIRAC